MQVPSLGHEDPLEKEIATHSSILSSRNPWTEEPSGLQSTELQESDMTKETQHVHNNIYRGNDEVQYIKLNIIYEVIKEIAIETRRKHNSSA